MNVSFNAFLLGQDMNDHTITELDVTFARGHVDIFDHLHRFFFRSFHLTRRSGIFAKDLHTHDERISAFDEQRSNDLHSHRGWVKSRASRYLRKRTTAWSLNRRGRKRRHNLCHRHPNQWSPCWCNRGRNDVRTSWWRSFAPEQGSRLACYECIHRSKRFNSRVQRIL